MLAVVKNVVSLGNKAKSYEALILPLQLQEEIEQLRKDLEEKEAELAAVKKDLGITPFVEFKKSMAHGWKVMGDKWKDVQETET